LNNPNVEIWEDKMVAVENGAAYGVAFPSGMSAITTAILAAVPLGGAVLYTEPVYGGTYFFFEGLGSRFGINTTSVDTIDLASVEAALRDAPAPFDLIFLETPANPTMAMADIACGRSRRSTAKERHLSPWTTLFGPCVSTTISAGRRPGHVFRHEVPQGTAT
jgi:methionine-gamma-lyase